MRLTNAYAAAPLCSPTRAALVSGLYPARTGITDFLRGDAAPSDKRLSPGIATVPDVLGPLGYTTGLIGKWHLTETYSGEYRDRPGNPYQHGFDEAVACEQQYIGDGDYFHPYFFMPTLPPRSPGECLTDRIADEAVDFITRHRDEPFFVHVCNYAVHTGWTRSPTWWRSTPPSPAPATPRTGLCWPRCSRASTPRWGGSPRPLRASGWPAAPCWWSPPTTAGPTATPTGRYHNGLKRVGWDLRINGRLVTAGAEPLTNLDGTVDLSGPRARYALVLRGSTTAPSPSTGSPRTGADPFPGADWGRMRA